MKGIDLIGQKFNRLTVLEFAFVKNKNQYYKCLCDCGNIIITRKERLKSGRTTSCGCYLTKVLSEFNDLSGNTFGKLFVIEPVYKKSGIYYYKCLCDCGREVVIRGQRLKNGITKSCGCGKIEAISAEKNHNWRGGVSKKKNKYPPEWTESLKESIRNRDGRYCQFPNCEYCDISGKVQKLHVHHINGIKTDCSRGNLISLCNSHHIQIESTNPEQWQEYFYQKTNDYRIII